MPDLEDAEADIAQQEKWGLTQTGWALKRLAAAVRIIRARGVLHDNRLDALETARRAIEARLDAIEARLNRIDPPA